MYKLIVSILITGFSISAFAQKKQDVICNPFKELKYKERADTIIIKATFKETARMVLGGPIFATLDKENKIESKEFTYQISFQPQDCTERIYAPSNIKNFKSFSGLIDKVVYVTCVVFKRPEWERKGDLPFFVAIAIRPEKTY